MELNVMFWVYLSKPVSYMSPNVLAWMAFCCYDMNQASMPFWSLVLKMTGLQRRFLVPYSGNFEMISIWNRASIHKGCYMKSHFKVLNVHFELLSTLLLCWPNRLDFSPYASSFSVDIRLLPGLSFLSVTSMRDEENKRAAKQVKACRGKEQRLKDAMGDGWKKRLWENGQVWWERPMGFRERIDQ